MDLVRGARGSASGKISVEEVPLSVIKANPRNPRQHDRKQISELARSIDRFGFIHPVVIDELNELLCGHARVAAAAALGFVSVPAVRARLLSEVDKRALIIADNRLAERSSWNKELLRQELAFLSDLDIDFDFSALGFDTAEVDAIIGGGGESDDGADVVPVHTDVPAVSRPGDLWLLDGHRLLCGSALEASAHATLLSGDQARMVFTDPPYNVPIEGHAGGRGRIKHREFAMASGEMSASQFVEFLQIALHYIQASVADGSMCFVCMDWRHAYDLLQAAKGLTLKNVCVWVKNNAGLGSLYRSQHEFVFLFKCGAADHINNVELGKHGRNRTNVWEYRGINSFGADRQKLLQSHPTVKPVALVADAIRDCSNRGDLILDPFGGSGTTLIAAEKTKRRAALIEIDPLYVDVTVRRWQALTGRTAVLAGSGGTFSDRERLLGNS